MIYLLFGEMGIGKNYVGEKLAEHVGCLFFDGDTVVPPPMLEKVLNFKPLGAEDIDDYVTNHLIPGIKKKYQNKLVVAQALYREKHRNQICAHFGEEKVKLIWVQSNSVIAHAKRLLSREKGWQWLKYGILNKPFFQKPSTQSNVHVITNEQNKDLISQFEKLV